MAAGTWRGDPLTKMLSRAWMWKMVCSLDWQRISSTLLPVAAVAVLASGAAAGTGTPLSGPAGPAEGAGLRVPSVLSGASLSCGLPPADAPGPPPVTASTMPTTTAITTTAAPPPIIQLRRRLRRASAARIRATLSLACCLVLLAFDTAAFSHPSARRTAAAGLARERARSGRLGPVPTASAGGDEHVPRRSAALRCGCGRRSSGYRTTGNSVPFPRTGCSAERDAHTLVRADRAE